MVNRMVEDIALDIKRGYEQVYGDNIVEIYLYGSYARGDYDAESDIDFVAVVDGERLDLQRKLKVMWYITADLGIKRDKDFLEGHVMGVSFVKINTNIDLDVDGIHQADLHMLGGIFLLILAKIL